MNSKIFKFTWLSRKGDDFQKRELFIQNYPAIAILLILGLLILVVVFKEQIVHMMWG